VTAAGSAPQPDLASESTSVAPVVEPVGDLQALIDLWPAVVELVEVGNGLVGAVIANATPVDIAGEDLTVGFPTSASFFKKKAEDPVNRTMVIDALRQLAGGRWRISYELREELDETNGEGARSDRYTEEEWVARFKAELDAEEIPIEPAPVPAPSAEKGE